MGSKGSDRVRSDDRFDLDKGSRVMNDGKTVHQYNNMAVRTRRKSNRNLAGLTSKQIKVKQQGVFALERVNNTVYTEGLDKEALSVVPPIKSRPPPQYILMKQ